MTNSNHPYKSQPAKAFWRQAVQEHHFLEITDWYKKKWPITNARISTAGSCFAQHIGRRLRQNGFNYNDTEPAPGILSPDKHLEYGYGLYSARYGNIYTTRQLLQLLQRAMGEFKPREQPWEKDGGWVDPFRPTIEPLPVSSVEEIDALRDNHLEAVRRLFERTDVFVFTLGLTEAWLSKEDGAAFPVCPGTYGGSFDSDKYRFMNFGYPDIRIDMEAFIARARQFNSRMKFLLTVSPVPLMATATPNHVVVATTYSKSVLRAVAGYLADKFSYVDYFPSFEIISSPVMHGNFYNPDQRTVVEAGVEHVMRQFFREHAPPAPGKGVRKALNADEDDEDVVCDEELLAAFGAAQ